MLHSFAGSPQVLVRLALDGFPINQVLVDVFASLIVRFFLRLVGSGTLQWTVRITVGRLVFTRWHVVQGPRRCAFSHISAGKAPQQRTLLWCTGTWQQGWSAGSHPQALSRSLVFQAGAPAVLVYTIPGMAGNGCVHALILVFAASASRIPHSGGSCRPFARRHLRLHALTRA